MSTSLRDLQAALHRKTGFEVLEHTDGDLRLRLGGRQRQDRMNTNVPNWLLVVRELIRHAGKQSTPWTVDLSKHYITKGQPPNDVLYFYWRVIFQVSEGKISDHFDDIIRVILAAPKVSRGEITEFPLPGANADRNSNGGIMRGRGASGTKG